MKKYVVRWARTETMYQDFYVEATSEKEAQEKAEELCNNHDWTDNEIIDGGEEPVCCKELSCNS